MKLYRSFVNILKNYDALNARGLYIVISVAHYQYLTSVLYVESLLAAPSPSELYAQSPVPLVAAPTLLHIHFKYPDLVFCGVCFILPPVSWGFIKLLSRFGRLIARVRNPWAVGATNVPRDPTSWTACLHLSLVLVCRSNSPSICLRVSVAYPIKLSFPVKLSVKMDSCFPNVLWVYEMRKCCQGTGFNGAWFGLCGIL